MILIFDNLKLKDPQIEVISYSCRPQNKMLIAEVKFFSADYQHIRSLNDFTYTDSVSDDMVNELVNQWLLDNVQED